MTSKKAQSRKNLASKKFVIKKLKKNLASRESEKIVHPKGKKLDGKC